MELLNTVSAVYYSLPSTDLNVFASKMPFKLIAMSCFMSPRSRFWDATPLF